MTFWMSNDPPFLNYPKSYSVLLVWLGWGGEYLGFV